MGIASWASENEKLLAQQENLLFTDAWTTFFLSPESRMLMYSGSVNKDVACIFSLQYIPER